MSVPPVFNWENVLSTSRQLLCLCQLSVGAGDFQAHHGLFMKRAGCHPPARMSNSPLRGRRGVAHERKWLGQAPWWVLHFSPCSMGITHHGIATAWWPRPVAVLLFCLDWGTEEL